MRSPQPCWPEDDRYADVKHRLALIMGHTHRGPLRQRTPEGLGNVETMVLITLDDMLSHGQTAHPGDIARRVHSKPSALSQTLKTLEEKGLIERHRGSCSDFRSVSVTLTPEGAAAVDEARRLHNESMNALLDYLGEDDVNELLRILDRIAAYRESTAGEVS